MILGKEGHRSEIVWFQFGPFLKQWLQLSYFTRVSDDSEIYRINDKDRYQKWIEKVGLKVIIILLTNTNKNTTDNNISVYIYLNT